LKVQEAPDPQPRKGEVVVQVKAAGLNFAEILARQGLYPDGPKKPCVMGYEVAGVVEAVVKALIRICSQTGRGNDTLRWASGKSCGSRGSDL